MKPVMLALSAAWVALASFLMSGCVSIGAWQAPRKDGASCRKVRPIMPPGFAYDECRMRVEGTGKKRRP